MKSEPVRYIDRRTGLPATETVLGDRALRFAYETLLGRTLWPVLFGGQRVSAWMGRRYDSPRSRKAIAKLAQLPGCNPGEAEKPWMEYCSFNEFFTRRLRPGARPVGEGFVSPGDGRLKLYLDIDAGRPFPLKGASRPLTEIFSPAGCPPELERCDLAVLRLAPVDYHRFHFPCDCRTPEPPLSVPGEYHSVNPVALLRRPDVYALNERQIVRCTTAAGDFWLVDVGAFGVGTIVQTYTGVAHAKGEEKGYFKFGGSTIIVAARAGMLDFDEDLRRHSAAGFETRVLCGERIAGFSSGGRACASL